MHFKSFFFPFLITFTVALVIVCLLTFSTAGVQNVNALCATDLSGAWQGNDGGTYYIQQNGNDIWWAGGTSFKKGSGFSNVFDGQRTGDSIKGSWADVPIGDTRADGDLSLQCNQDANNDILTRTSATGGFGGSEWLKPKDVFKKFFTWNNLNIKDCTLITAYINLYSNGKGIWHADVISDSDDDSWIVLNIVIKDANGNQLFTIPRFSSPTLSEGPLPFAYGPGPGPDPEEDKIRWWNNENIQFPPELYDRIGGASLSYDC